MSDDPLKSHVGTREEDFEDMGRGSCRLAAAYHVQSSRNNQSDSLFTCYRVEVYARGNKATQLVNSKVNYSQRIGPPDARRKTGIPRCRRAMSGTCTTRKNKILVAG